MNKVYFDMDTCPSCGKEFDSSLTKTKHHVVPKFLNPAKEVLVPLCKPCHIRLNECYVHVSDKKVTKDFTQFKEKYEALREEYKARKIDRGTFGEGLWTNLVSYLNMLADKEGEKK